MLEIGPILSLEADTRGSGAFVHVFCTLSFLFFGVERLVFFYTPYFSVSSWQLLWRILISGSNEIHCTYLVLVHTAWFYFVYYWLCRNEQTLSAVPWSSANDNAPRLHRNFWKSSVCPKAATEQTLTSCMKLSVPSFSAAPMLWRLVPFAAYEHGRQTLDFQFLTSESISRAHELP